MLARALVFTLLIGSLAYAQAGAGGGNITSANLDLNQPLSQWYFFYSATNGSADNTISVPGGSDLGASGKFQAVSLPGTSGFYLISDSENPFSDTMAAANLTAFDQHFNLSSRESAALVFNDTSQFSLQAGTSTPGATLNLPTLYIPGKNDTHAFRVGIGQAGSNFIFVVPSQTAVGMDNQSYDFQFFLPYYFNETYTFHVFSITPPSSAAIGPILKPLNYRWSYNGSRLQVQTEAYASMSMVDLLGKAYNSGADGSGLAQMDIAPGRYTLHLSKSGFSDLTDTLYLPAPIPMPETENETTGLTGQKPPQVSVTRSLDGVTVCVDQDCYFQAVAEADSARLLTELSCSGSLCQLINISPYSYIQKHQMVRLAASPSRSGPAQADSVNVSGLLDSLGRGLSNRFGGTADTSSGGTIIYIVGGALVLGGAAFLLTKAWPFRPKEGGYD
ncbi:Uncharacterised protein [uncultured archaeon]|nr:Uncharacterised protein [uncultured archaeon]